MLREKLLTTIYDADTSTRRRQIEAPRIDLLSGNPMVVEKIASPRCRQIDPGLSVWLSGKDIGNLRVSLFFYNALPMYQNTGQQILLA